MALLGGEVAYRLLRVIAPAEPAGMTGAAYQGTSKLEKLFGPDIWSVIRDKVVIDFGCGSGAEAIELAQHGSSHVYGVDISERLLSFAREHAAKAACGNVTFGATLREPADMILSVDAFEHFADPAAILKTMAGMLKPGGELLACFGPTWYHPRGGHLFSVFPWAHLIFSEAALCRWRSHIRNDGAKKFSEVEGGLNQMTIGRFEQLVSESPFEMQVLEPVPIRPAQRFHNRMTREFLTSVVRCRMRLTNPH